MIVLRVLIPNNELVSSVFKLALTARHIMPRFSSTVKEYARYPINQGEPETFDLKGQASVNGSPPFVAIFLRLEEDLVVEARHTSHGCGVTTAACSVLTEMAMGKSTQQCLQITCDDLLEELEGLPPDKQHCAKIATSALHNAVQGGSN